MTFIEVLIALFIFTLMVSAVFPVFLTTRKMDLYTKSFTQARQLAQSRIEWIYSKSKLLNYPDMLYQLSTTEGYTCTGFSWVVDPITLVILYNEPASVVNCTKTVLPYDVTIVLTKDETILTVNFVDLTLSVVDNTTSTPIKLYETLYATSFN